MLVLFFLFGENRILTRLCYKALKNLKKMPLYTLA